MDYANIIANLEEFEVLVPNNLDDDGKLPVPGFKGCYLGTTSKKKSKKQDFVPLSVDPYPPTIKREVLIRDNLDFFLPPNLLIEIGTFFKKKWAPKHIYRNFNPICGGVENIR